MLTGTMSKKPSVSSPPMDEAARAAENRRRKRREAADSDEPLRKRGRPVWVPSPTANACIATRRDAEQLGSRVAANARLGYGGALALAEQVKEARQLLQNHRYSLAELAYNHGITSGGKVWKRQVKAERMLLRARHITKLAKLAAKVYDAGAALECLSLKTVVGDSNDVAVLVELLRIMESYVIRGRLPLLKFVMINGQAAAACGEVSGRDVQPVCTALMSLAAACAAAGRPLHGVNWAEAAWSDAAMRAAAYAIVEAQIPKFQLFTVHELLSPVARQLIREGRWAAERAAVARGEKPWWRDPSYVQWIEVRDGSHKCMQGFGCGQHAPSMGSENSLWWGHCLTYRI